MFDAEKCRANAARCTELASCATDPADREIWVKIAYGWLEMATEIERDGPAALVSESG